MKKPVSFPVTLFFHFSINSNWCPIFIFWLPLDTREDARMNIAVNKVSYALLYRRSGAHLGHFTEYAVLSRGYYSLYGYETLNQKWFKSISEG